MIVTVSGRSLDRAPPVHRIRAAYGCGHLPYASDPSNKETRALAERISFPAFSGVSADDARGPWSRKAWDPIGNNRRKALPQHRTLHPFGSTTVARASSQECLRRAESGPSSEILLKSERGHSTRPLLPRHSDLESLLRRNQVIVVVIAEVDLHPFDAPVKELPLGP